MNDPVNGIDSQGTDEWKDNFGYDSEIEAVTAAYSRAVPATWKTGLEYGGEIYKQDGKYYYNLRGGRPKNPLNPQERGSVTVGRANCPPDSAVALFHTHPAEGSFSGMEGDKKVAFSEALKIYLVTPLGSFSMYDPNTKKTKDLGRLIF
jgi:hypothetical protein